MKTQAKKIQELKEALEKFKKEHPEIKGQELVNLFLALIQYTRGGWHWQKVPLSTDRDTVSAVFLKELYALVLNPTLPYSSGSRAMTKKRTKTQPKPTGAWRTFSKRPICDHEDGPWLIQVGDDPEDFIVAMYIHEREMFFDGVTRWVSERVVRFAKIF